jgi:hypothetical protein
MAWQRIMREKVASSGGDLLGEWWSDIDNSLCSSTVAEITYSEAAEIILKYEWLGDMPQAVTRCFGMFNGRYLSGALVFAEKPGANLQSNGASIVPKDSYYLARGACAHWAHPHAASWFISKVCRDMLCKANGSVLAYADPMAGEVGTIYQALGWYYLGPSKGGQSGFMVDGKMIGTRSFNRDRKYAVGQGIEDVKKAFPRAKEIIPIGRKHRYLGVYGDKKYKNLLRAKLLEFSKPYPKRAAAAPTRGEG